MQTAIERDDPMAALRRSILEAALPHVPFDGWSQATLEAGARDAGLGGGEALRAFPGGPVEAIAFWSTDADRAMVAALEAMDLGAMRTRDRIAAAIRQRLAAIAPHREALRRAPPSSPGARSMRYGASPATARPTGTSTRSAGCWPASTARRCCASSRTDRRARRRAGPSSTVASRTSCACRAPCPGCATGWPASPARCRCCAGAWPVGAEGQPPRGDSRVTCPILRPGLASPLP